MSEDQPHWLEEFSGWWSRILDWWLALVSAAITLALLVMGNTLARLIGGFFALVLVLFAARRVRSREGR